MATIGIYDSGIGGLTTAKILLDRFSGNDIYYLADNAHHPFGNTDLGRLKEIVKDGIKRVRSHSDIAVLACNTASSITDDKNVIRLLPPIDDYSDSASETLIMATSRTLKTLHCYDSSKNTSEAASATALSHDSDFEISSALSYSDGSSRTMLSNLSELPVKNNFQVADTPELATLIEIQASLGCVRGSLTMDELLPYLFDRIGKFSGVKQVILGCSHYLYCKSQISQILGSVSFADGNDRLCKELSALLLPSAKHEAKITFDFTSQNEEKKYKRILSLYKQNR